MAQVHVFSRRKLKMAREAKGMSRETLAHLTNLSVTSTTIKNYETGKYTPQLDTMSMLARALDLSVFDLMEITDAKG